MATKKTVMEKNKKRGIED